MNQGLDVVILVIGFAVAHYVAKLGKTELQGVAIWMVTMGGFLWASFYFDQKETQPYTLRIV